MKVWFKKNWYFLLLIVLAAASNIFWHYYFGGDEVTGDAAQYQEIAINLFNHKGFVLQGQLTMYREPGYPFFLYLIYQLVGIKIYIVQFIQFLLHLGTALLTYFIAKKYFSNFTSKFSTLLVILFPMYNIYANRLLSEIFAVFLLMLFCRLFDLAYQKERLYYFAFIGILLAVLVYVKSAFSLFALPLIILIFWLYKTKDRLFILKRVVLFLICFIIVILPWILRNYNNFGSFSLTSREGTILYRRAAQVLYTPLETEKYIISSIGGEYFVRRFIDPTYDFERNRKAAIGIKEELALSTEQLITGITNADQIDRIYIKQAKSIILQHPIKFLAQGVLEVVNLNSPIIYYEKQWSMFHDRLYSFTWLKVLLLIILRLIWLSFVLLVGWTIYFIFKTKKQTVYLLAFFVLYLNMVLFFLQGFPRLLLPVFPIYFMFTAFSLERFISWLIKKYPSLLKMGILNRFVN